MGRHNNQRGVRAEMAPEPHPDKAIQKSDIQKPTEGLCAEEQRRDMAIREFDTWFRYAEEIGQHRLYNFLMSASILLLACATILTSQAAPWNLAKVLSVFGIILSFLWVIIGRRQHKFHVMLECEITKLLDGHPYKDKFTIYHVQNLKKPPLPNTSNKLSFLERKLATRNFLWIVPGVFLLVFLLTFLMSFQTFNIFHWLRTL